MPIFPPFRRWYRDRQHEQDRTDTLDRYGYRCADCGRSALELGGLKFLHLSHENHDPRDRRVTNRVCRCVACHNTHDAAQKRTARRRWLEWVGQLAFPGLEALPAWVRPRGNHDQRSAQAAIGGGGAASARIAKGDFASDQGGSGGSGETGRMEGER